MSAIENVYQELSARQKKQRDDNEKSRRRRELLEIAGTTAIGLYKANMEDKVDDFFQNAEVIKSKNVYNQAQQLNETYADHAKKALDYLGGEEQYVFDTFVTPYVTKIAQQEYDGWDTGYTDASKTKVLNNLSDKFRNDIYERYKEIQGLRSKVDLSQNFEEFVDDANLFPDSMGADIVSKVFGKGQNKADALLQSSKGVLEQLSPEIYELGGKQVFEAGGFEAAKDYIASAKPILSEKWNRSEITEIPTLTQDGKTLKNRRVFIERSALDPDKIRFLAMDGKTEIPMSDLAKRQIITREITYKDFFGNDVKKTVYIEETVDVNGKILTTVPEPSNAQESPESELPIALGTQDYSSVKEKVSKGVLNQNNNKFDKDRTINDVIVEQAEIFNTDADAYRDALVENVSRELYKLSTTFSNENQDAIALATRIVLNRRERLIGKDGEVDDTNTFHRGTHLGYTGAANGLEVLEAYADSVALGTVPLTQDNLKTFLKLLEKTNVAAQADIMRNEGKNQILNDMFNKDSVRTLFSEAFLEKALVGTTMEESIAKIQVIQEMERQFENISGFTIPKPTNLDTEIDNNLNAPGLDDGDGDPKPVVTEDKSILPPPRSVMTEQPSLVKNYKIDKAALVAPFREDTQIPPAQILMQAIKDPNVSKAQVAAIGLGALLDSGTRAFVTDISAISEYLGDKAVAGKDAYFQAVKKSFENEMEEFYKPIYEYVFVPPGQRTSKGSIDSKKLNEVISGLSEDSQEEIKSEISEMMVVDQETQPKPSLLSKPEDTSSIPDSVEGKIKFVGNILGDNERAIEFMTRVINTESRLGKDPRTYEAGGDEGVAQVNRVAFDQVMKKLTDRRNRLSKYVKPFEEATGINLTEVQFEDLNDNDLLSIAFGRMYLRQRTGAGIPKSLAKQAEYWKKYYNTSAGAGEIEDFINANRA